MTKYLLIPICLLMTACGEPISYCEREIQPVICEKTSVLDAGIFEMCLSKVVDMRSSKGGNYTTHDDEDLHHAINSCSSAASPNYSYVDRCFKNTNYKLQQEVCNDK